MPYEFFEHKADIGIRGIGESVEKAFEEAAKAMFSVMFSLDNVKREIEVNVECEARSIEELFVEWLNTLLAEKDINYAVFSHFKVERIEKSGESWVLRGKAWGEKLDVEKHKPEVEVKAATYSQLKVEYDKERKLWIVQCVVDV